MKFNLQLEQGLNQLVKLLLKYMNTNLMSFFKIIITLWNCIEHNFDPSVLVPVQVNVLGMVAVNVNVPVVVGALPVNGRGVVKEVPPVVSMFAVTAPTPSPASTFQVNVCLINEINYCTSLNQRTCFCSILLMIFITLVLCHLHMV
jgi:hypothetical protein